MHGTSARIDAADIPRFNEGDEGALENVFRSQYDSLVAVAAAELDDPARASRLVVATFREAWDQRRQFKLPGDLELFLRERVHAQAIREHNRVASLHRFEEREGVVAAAPAAHQPPPMATVDDAWAALAASLHPDPADDARSAHARHDASRHGAALHVAKVGNERRDMRSLLLVLAVAVVVAVAIFAANSWLRSGNESGRVDGVLAREDARVVSTRAAMRANTSLPDGSQVALGPDTQLRIPAHYPEPVRAVGLAGTASFTVAEHSKPFFVKVGPALVRATGTVIDVSSLGDSVAIIRAREGTVDVEVGDEHRSLGAGEAVAVGRDSAVSTPNAEALTRAFGWTDGRFTVVDLPLGALPPLLQRWYGIQVTLADTTLADRRISIDVPLNSTRLMIAEVERAGQVTYASRGESRVFRDAATPPR